MVLLLSHFIFASSLVAIMSSFSTIKEQSSIRKPTKREEKRRQMLYFLSVYTKQSVNVNRPLNITWLVSLTNFDVENISNYINLNFLYDNGYTKRRISHDYHRSDRHWWSMVMLY